MKNKLLILVLLNLPGLMFAQGYSKIDNDPHSLSYLYFSALIPDNHWISLPHEGEWELKPKKIKKVKSYSNKNCPRNLKPLGINITAGGPSLVGVSFDYFVTPFLNIEAGGGYLGLYSGVKYHLVAYRNDPWTPYFGIQGTYSFEGKAGIYIPGGFHFIGRHSVSFSFEFALWIESQEIETNPLNSVEYLAMISLKAGYRF